MTLGQGVAFYLSHNTIKEMFDRLEHIYTGVHLMVKEILNNFMEIPLNIYLPG